MIKCIAQKISELKNFYNNVTIVYKSNEGFLKKFAYQKISVYNLLSVKSTMLE